MNTVVQHAVGSTVNCVLGGVLLPMTHPMNPHAQKRSKRIRVRAGYILVGIVRKALHSLSPRPDRDTDVVCVGKESVYILLICVCALFCTSGRRASSPTKALCKFKWCADGIRAAGSSLIAV